MIPHLLCARCGAVFADPDPADPADPGGSAVAPTAGRIVVCPACGHRGAPGGAMRPSAPPDAASFGRSVAAALGVAADERDAAPGADGAPPDGDAL